MNKSSFFVRALPHIIAVVSFVVISIFMYRPIIFEGKVMDQNDINQGKGAASEIIEYRERTGDEALWTNSMFGGMPAYLISLRWGGAMITDNLQRLLLLYLPRPVGENFLAFLTFYILLLTFGVRPYLAIGGAIAFGLSTFFVVSIQAGHMWKIRAIAYMPLVLAGIRLIFTKKYLFGFILTSIALALEINANHLQITYYLFLLLSIYGISELISDLKEKHSNEFLKKAVVIVLASLLAAGTNLGRLWTTSEYGKYSIRGRSELTNAPSESREGLDPSYAFRWSSGKWESMTLLIPHLYGGGSGVYHGKDSELGEVLRRNNVPRNEINQYERAYLGYWGSQPGTAGPAYVGAVSCFLFVLAFFFVDNRTKYWMVAGVVLSIMLSWGKNFPAFNNLMFDVFPGYNKFRAVTMVIILALMIIPLMGFLGMERLIAAGWNKQTQKKLLLATGITIFLAISAWIVTKPPAIEEAPAWLSEAVFSDRKGIIQTDTFRTILYVVLTFGAVYFYLKGKISMTIFAAIVIALVVLDLGLVDSRYLNDGAYKKESNRTYLDKTPADEEILKDKTLGYRVLNLQDPFNEARTSNFHKSLGGYHGAKMRRYQDLISRHLVPEMQQIIQDQGITRSNTNVISMLNAKYILAGLQANAVIKNRYSNGAAWFVENINMVNSPDEEIAQIGNVDLSRTAVIDQTKFQIDEFHADSLAKINLISYEPNNLVYEASTRSNTLAVFSEIFYPRGWKAFVDGSEAKILRVNYVLRALEVPAGEHKIEFRFEPDSYYIGNKIMMISSLILILAIGYGLFKLWKASEMNHLQEV
jgi:heme A synthase